MYKGGVVINQRTEWLIRLSGFIIPFVLIGYGVLIQLGFITASHYKGSGVFYGLLIPWTIFGIYQFVYKIRGALDAAIRMIVYHVCAAIFIIFIAGFSMALIAGWVILFLASYAFFSQLGLRLSIAILFVVAGLDIAVYHGQTSVIISDALAVVSILIVGMTAVAIGRVQEVDGLELSRSKELENLQRDRILTIVNNLADAVLSTDESGVVRVYNAASLSLLDTNNSLNGHHIDEVIELYDQDNKRINLLEEFKKSKGVTVRDDLTFTNGTDTLRLEVTYSPISSSYRTNKQGMGDGYIVIMRDVTKTKSLEEERDEFISVVSHELRTPITVAEGTISNVQVMMDRPDIAPEILRDGLSTAHEQILFLSKMVNDLSTLSRAERGVADAPEVIDVRELVSELYMEYNPQATKKGLHFNLDLDSQLGRVTASRLYIKELIQNLITNAIKYTKEGSVMLRVSIKNGRVTFEIKDTGIGISKTDQAKIFNKFYRSEDYRTRETGGTGLGLYVAAKLARKLGTKIELNSRLNHGSSFWFSMPVEK